MLLPNDIVDPHIHQWDPLTTPRHVSREAALLRRLPRVPRSMKWLLPQAKREFVGNPAYLLKPYLPLDYLQDTADVSVSQVVHIEAAWVSAEHRGSVEETRWVTALPFGVRGAPRLGAVVIHADPRWSDIAEVLDEQLETSSLVRGVRFSASHLPDQGVRDFADTPGILASADFLRGFAALAERNLSFELWVYSHQLPDAHILVQEYPEVSFVLDHYATPVGAFGRRGRSVGRTPAQRADLMARWRDDIDALAQHPNVVAKHSGLGMPLLGGETRRPIDSIAEYADRCAPLIRHLHDAFGADRTMWASNYPIDKPGHTLPASIDVLLEVLGSDAQPDKLLRDVARRVYRLSD